MTSSRLNFSTKANTLLALNGKLTTAKIAPIIVFTVQDWKTNQSYLIKHVIEILGDTELIVRSSCSEEDLDLSSNAGAFLSVLNVNLTQLKKAVDDVILSYRTPKLDDQILIQPMLKDVVRSGVCFSHDPNTCTPYRIITWTEGTNTSAVTGGLDCRTWQMAAGSIVPPPKEIKGIIYLFDELLSFFSDRPIDFEFAITQNKNVEALWLLQVRPLILDTIPQSIQNQNEILKVVEAKVNSGIKKHPSLLGSTTIYGVMPDWNPAEIIGIRPKPLALSLYRELITDSIWAYQRHNYGYRNLRSFPLMTNFFGLPYIDVRVSFNSFIPSDLNEELGDRLIEYYLDRITEFPELHDKIEFEIIFSCYTFDVTERLEPLLEKGFSAQETALIKDNLLNITNELINPNNSLWNNDIQKIDILNTRRRQLLESKLQPIEKIYWLLEDAKRYGTLPFAGLARIGFIAIQILKSLVTIGIISKQEHELILSGIKTISSEMKIDKTVLGKDAFISKYGHLRPGTYEICSARYDKAPDKYFNWDSIEPPPEPTKICSPLPSIENKLKPLLKSHGLEITPQDLMTFIEKGIIYRELSKFHFTRNLSDALELIAELGQCEDFSREELTFTDIGTYKELFFSAADTKEKLNINIKQGKLTYEETLKICLPPLITKPEDVWSFEWPQTTPNFITLKEVTASIKKLDEQANIDGYIICIPNADPGFDWIFSHKIRGLITAWGGANSHMAIRAGELGLPAVIGSGEVLYEKWSTAKRVFINCAAKKVEIIE